MLLHLFSSLLFDACKRCGRKREQESDYKKKIKYTEEIDISCALYWALIYMKKQEFVESLLVLVYVKWKSVTCKLNHKHQQRKERLQRHPLKIIIIKKCTLLLCWLHFHVSPVCFFIPCYLLSGDKKCIMALSIIFVRFFLLLLFQLHCNESSYAFEIITRAIHGIYSFIVLLLHRCSSIFFYIFIFHTLPCLS